MSKTYITPSLLAQIFSLLPTITFNPDWVGKTEYFEPLLRDVNPEDFVDGQVHVCVDNLGRYVFIARYGDSMNVLFQRSTISEASLNEPVHMVFQGSAAVADAMGFDSPCGTVGLDEIGGYFAFFGPEEVAALLIAAIEQNNVSASATTTATTPANDEVVIDPEFVEIAQISPEAADRLARLRAAIANNPKAEQQLRLPPYKQQLQGTVLFNFDTPMKKAGLIAGVGAVLGLAIYGGYRVMRG